MKDVIETLSPTQRAFLLQVVTECLEVIKQRDELLAALEDTIAMARALSEVQNAYIEETVDAFTAGDIDDLIARVKAAAVTVAISETQEGK